MSATVTILDQEEAKNADVDIDIGNNEVFIEMQ
jgi:hypothetical protein